MSKVKIFLLLQFLFFSALPVFAQTVDTAWVRRYNGPENDVDIAYEIAVDGNGNVYVTGESYGISTLYDYATIKYSPSGDTLWVSRYNGPGNADDHAVAITVDDSGNAYVTGYSGGEYATIKYAPDGDTLWVRRYNGPGNGGDFAYAVVVDDGGNVYVTGSSDGSGTSADYATVKYAPNGDTLWVRRYNGPANSADYPGGLSETFVMSLGPLAVDSEGNVYVTGSSWNGTSLDFATIKYTPNGDTLWVRRYNGPTNSGAEARALALDGNGNVYVIGYSYDSVPSYDYATIKYAPNGDTLWVRRYDGPEDFDDYDAAFALAVDDSGNVYVTGYSNDSVTSYDYATIKYAPNGDTVWVKRYNGPGNGSDQPFALAVDGNGNVYVTGFSDSHYGTIGYSPSGDTLWVRTYGLLFSIPLAIAVDGNSNVYVTGVAGDSADYTTIKYSLSYPLPIRQDSLVITAYSPVNLVVTDPTNDSIGLNFNTILEGSTYDTTQDVSVPPDGVNDDVIRILKPFVGDYEIRVDPDGEGNFSLGIRIDGSDQVYLVTIQPVPETSTTYEYSVLVTLRGDVNKDKSRNLTDVIFLVNYVFRGGPAPDPVDIGNVNCSTGNPNLTDIIYMVNYVFKGEKAPCS